MSKNPHTFRIRRELNYFSSLLETYLKSVGIFLLTLVVFIRCFGQAEMHASDENVKAFEFRYHDLKSAFRISNRLIENIHNYSDSLKSDIYSVRGTLYQQKEAYAEALKFHQKALKIRNRLGDQIRIAKSKFNIANAYFEMGNLELSKKYHFESLKIMKSLFGKGPECIGNYNSIGSFYLELSEHDSAYIYYSQALNLIKSNGLEDDPLAADVYLNMGILEEEKQHLNLAMAYLIRAHELQLKDNDLDGLSKSQHHIGIIYELRNNFPKAESYYKKAFALASELDCLEDQRDISASFMKLYNKEGLRERVDYYFDQYTSFDKEVQERVNNKTVRGLETEFQMEIKDQQLKLSEAKRKAQAADSKYRTIAFVLSLLIILTFFYFLIRTYRQKQRIALMQVDLKNREITDLLNQQESTAYAAMLDGQERERLRIARDLHDRLGSTLAAVKLGLQSDPVALNTQNQQLVDSAITEVRSVAHNLSGMNIERYGLNIALYELKIRIERTGKINMELYLDETPPGIELSVELYRVAQELVSNTLKHAGAQTITVQTSHREQQFNLIYEDDGRGFDPAATPEGMGIRNIRHRLAKLNGHLDVDAQPGRGTIMNIHVTLNSGL